MSEPDIIAEMRELLYSQSASDIRDMGWDKVREVRVHPADFEALKADLPSYEGPESLYSIRVTVDPWLRRGMVIPLDEKGNVILLPGGPLRAGRDRSKADGR